MQPLNDGERPQFGLPQKSKLHLRMGSKVRLRRGFHAGRLRGEASPRARLGDICGMAGDPYRRWFPADRPYRGGRDYGIIVRPYHCTHYTQVTLICSKRMDEQVRGVRS